MAFKKEIIIGRQEIVDLPDWGYRKIPAKIDTGAFTSAIHYSEMEHNPESVRFKLFEPTDSFYKNEWLELPIHDLRIIKNSFGQEEERIIIKTKIIISGLTFRTDFSLSNRSKLEFPALIGRRALYKRFLVDVSKKNSNTDSTGLKS